MLTYIRALACISPFSNKSFAQRDIFFLVTDKLPIDSSVKWDIHKSFDTNAVTYGIVSVLILKGDLEACLS